jgi:hypothetical protein
MIIANPYTEDSLKKFNSMELLLPKTGEVISICKLPQSLYTPGKLIFNCKMIVNYYLYCITISMDLKSSKSVWTSNQVNQYGPQIK